MDTVKLIKTEQEYEAALSAIESLVDRNPAPGTAEGDRLEVLAVLVQEYESKKFTLSPADPLEAIRFRMEQQGLAPRDLVPYFGSRAKVSEVLSGKRELTLSMMRALHTRLGIPAESLLATGKVALLDEPSDDWERFPLKEMVARGWIKATAADIRDRAEELLREFLAPLGPHSLAPSLYRKSDHVRAARTMDPLALTAWTARVLLLAQKEQVEVSYVPGTVTNDFLKRLVQLSTREDGPVAAREYLRDHGIVVVVQPHLARTHLDGAAMMSATGVPVIGLTLRYDRLDNFWFTLMHELVHVARHLGKGEVRFFDDLKTDSGNDPREVEADSIAGEVLIPEAAWKRSPARVLPNPEAVQHLARELRVHPAIIAGRVQHENRNFKVLHHLVGRDEVRKWFPGVTWD